MEDTLTIGQVFTYRFEDTRVNGMEFNRTETVKVTGFSGRGTRRWAWFHVVVRTGTGYGFRVNRANLTPDGNGGYIMKTAPGCSGTLTPVSE